MLEYCGVASRETKASIKKDRQAEISLAVFLFQDGDGFLKKSYLRRIDTLGIQISKVTLYEEIIYFCLAVVRLPDGGGTAERDPGADTRPGELYQYHGG